MSNAPVQSFTIRGTHIHVYGETITPQEAELYLQHAASSKLLPSNHYRLVVGGDGVVWMESLPDGLDRYASTVTRIPRRLTPYQPNQPVDYDALLASQDVIAE